MTRRSATAALLALGTGLLACARALPPPGGEEDREPPQIIETVPEELSVVPGFDGPVIFRFDERISERNIENSALVSPETGEVKISRGRTEVRVELEGGWQPGVTYRVLLAPGIRDLFNNERRQPAELTFSTGPPISSTAIAGVVIDRVTGRPANQVIVEATRRADSLRYVTVADSQAFFTFRHLPTGNYDILAYADQNRNRRRDASEPLARGIVAPLNSDRDTLPLDLAVLPPDTTPPRLVRAEGRDSMQIRMLTDDWLEPEVPLETYRVRILALPDSAEVEGPHRLMKVDSFQAVVVARADSIRRDSLARADSLRIDSAGVADTLPPRPPAGRGQPPRVLQQQLGRGGQPQPGDMPPAGPLPFQELVVIPARPLAPGRYLLDVSGLQNISGRTGGGGTAPFEISPPPRRPARDTTDTSSLPVGAFDAGLERRSLDRPGFRPVTPGARE